MLSIIHPQGIAVDASHIYWTDGVGWVEVDNLDGSFVRGLATNEGESPLGITVDTDWIYYANYIDGSIVRIGKDFVLRDVLATEEFAGRPVGLAVDANHIYWTDETGNRILTTDMTGFGAVNTLVDGLNLPYGIAIG